MLNTALRVDKKERRPEPDKWQLTLVLAACVVIAVWTEGFARWMAAFAVLVVAAGVMGYRRIRISRREFDADDQPDDGSEP